MSQSHKQKSASVLTLRPPAVAEPGPERGGATRGFGRGAAGTRRLGGKGRKRRGTGLGARDRGPLGKSPDLEAMVARQRLGLNLVGRLSLAAVSRAWKLAAAEHHPDRGGQHGTMQAINGARDVLLGRGETATA